MAFEITANLKFNLEVTWNDTWVFPRFGNFDVIEPKLTKNGVGLVDIEKMPKRLQDLADWVRSDFNKWHVMGVDVGTLHPTL